MSGRELDPANDEDFVNILSHGTDIVVRKQQARKPSEKIRIGDVKVGKINGVKVGEPVDIQGAVSGKLSDLESIRVDDVVGAIQLITQNSVYGLDLADKAKKNRQMSLLFLRRGYLDYGDVMPDGFYDGGRYTKFAVENDRLVPKSPREIIVLHAGMDQALQKISHDAQRLLSNIPDVPTKIRILSLFVSNVMGGAETSSHPDTNIEKLCDKDIADVLKQTADGFLPIGYINHGVCRHRALLFKYLADRNGIPSRLVRGDTSGAHQWNVVKVNNQHFIVDVMQDPTQMYEETSDRAKAYKRQGVAKGFRGGFGGKSVGRVD